jgi:hypothetical protein
VRNMRIALVVMAMVAFMTITTVSQAAPHHAQNRKGTVEQSGFTGDMSGDPTQDTLYVDDGNTIKTYYFPANTLSTDAPPSNLGAPAGERRIPNVPQTQNLTKMGATCWVYSPDWVYSYQCISTYRYTNPPNDPSHWYRVFWWTVSSNAKTDHMLQVVNPHWWLRTTHSRVDDWAPIADINISQCGSQSVTLGVNTGGVTASVGQTVPMCPDSLGPAVGQYGPNGFGFAWNGNVHGSTVIGSIGGHELQIDKGYSYVGRYNVGFSLCHPWWIC